MKKKTLNDVSISSESVRECFAYSCIGVIVTAVIIVLAVALGYC